MLRASRDPLRIAMLVRIRKIQVFSDERPSKESTPRITAIHASCTTSSATALLGT
jgi:hypothetical protein